MQRYKKKLIVESLKLKGLLFFAQKSTFGEIFSRALAYMKNY